MFQTWDRRNQQSLKRVSACPPGRLSLILLSSLAEGQSLVEAYLGHGRSDSVWQVYLTQRDDLLASTSNPPSPARRESRGSCA